MIRLFVAIELPGQIREALTHVQAGLPGARWTPEENLHITLRFIGEVQEPAVEEIGEALWQIHTQGFRLALKGVGKFGGESRRSPARIVYAGIEHGRELTDLAMRIERAVTDAGFPPETRKFHPHVTLGRLRDTPPHRLGDFIAEHNLFASAPFEVREFTLFASHQGNEASIYEPLQSFALTAPAP